MTRDDWFGFRTVARGARVWHGFKTNRYGSKSLCGKARFGEMKREHPDAKPCATCARIWQARYRGTVTA